MFFTLQGSFLGDDVEISSLTLQPGEFLVRSALLPLTGATCRLLSRCGTCLFCTKDRSGPRETASLLCLGATL
jgi:hypothetical protein